MLFIFLEQPWVVFSILSEEVNDIPPDWFTDSTLEFDCTIEIFAKEYAGPHHAIDVVTIGVTAIL
ncbi:hypothetical protein DJ75_00705 [Halorubrum sp. Eb13]|nr:hypothetical protein DJ75_00705 [Halorubrum sp. Eb13]